MVLLRNNVNPFRTAAPFWGPITWNLSGLSPKRDCGSEGVKAAFAPVFSFFLFDRGYLLRSLVIMNNNSSQIQQYSDVLVLAA